jgi:GTP-binding protein LepA
MNNIRNFCIIAHIDHGKSTLADRILGLTGTVPERQLRAQTLDTMDIERERGITIKSQPIRIDYTAADGKHYVLNLIDTPGHVDFSYEVSRSLSACEGAVLLVDAAQGVEAQTLANAYGAIEHDLEIIPVLNKIDMPNARVDETRREVCDLVGLDGDSIILASAKDGTGVREVLEAVVRDVPPPKGDPSSRLRAFVFDSIYDSYRGVVVCVRVVDGCLKPGHRIRFMSVGREYEVSEVGVFRLERIARDALNAGEVGYVIANIRSVAETPVGDTITDARSPAETPLPGYVDVQPVVFCGLYPAEASGYEALRDALQKLALNDASFQYEPETSAALGFGFRLGFLGLLHMDVIQERLEREHGLTLVATSPSVVFRVTERDGATTEIHNPAQMPPAGKIESIEEPYIEADIIAPAEYVSVIIELCKRRRGIHKKIEYLDNNRVLIVYELPLVEVVLDFHDKLKSASRGYGSFDYRLSGYRPDKLVKLDILVNGEVVDALSTIVHRDKAAPIGRSLCQRLRELIPRQLYEVAIQSAIGGRIVSRETVKALRKNVTAKCYGGDITRKRKLLEKQKEGKRRMKRVGRVDIPQEAFMAVLAIED